MLLSVIIPTYNVEKYIAKCLDSILNQGLLPSEYEIIVVNDGTPDRSGEIAHEYATRYPSIIRVLDCQNAGVGMARNRGMDAAKGDYVVFIDPDDYWTPNSVKPILESAIENRLDLAAFGYQKVDVNGEKMITSPWNDTPTDRVYTGIEFLKEGRYLIIVCSYLYRRSFLNDNNLRFISIRYEDEDFMPRAICLSSRIKNFNVPVYNYMIHGESFMATCTASFSMDMMMAINGLKEFIDSGKISDNDTIIALKKRMNMLFIEEIAIWKCPKERQKILEYAIERQLISPRYVRGFSSAGKLECRFPRLMLAINKWRSKRK